MLLVQMYLQSGKTLEDLKTEHGVKSHETNDKVCFNYDQLEARNSDPLASQCRGLVLRKDTWEVVACPMFRFFNLEQTEVAADIDWASAVFEEKMDGCLDYDTIVKTELGDMKIGDIVSLNFDGNVYSFNPENGKVELDKVIAVSEKDNVDNWYEIELYDGTIIHITGNHKVYLPKLNAYRRVEDLAKDDEVLLFEDKAE